MVTMMETGRPCKRPRGQVTVSTRVLAPRRPYNVANAETPEEGAAPGESHDEGYHRLRREIGIAEPTEPTPPCSGFSEGRLRGVRHASSTAWGSSSGSWATCSRTSDTPAKPWTWEKGVPQSSRERKPTRPEQPHAKLGDPKRVQAGGDGKAPSSSTACSPAPTRKEGPERRT